MNVAKPSHPSEPPRHMDAVEIEVWIMIAVLLGLACLTFVLLLAKVAG
ncbi:MAG TPA: hypothetical protein VMJ75_24310 [Candidatus Acidoferrales bacterium]|nr:hypothetical protein [Candidatus Acidoferrales bacterium]